MKLSIHVLAVAVVCIGLSMELNAQEYRGDDYSPSCGAGGGCQHGHEGMGSGSMERLPYGRSAYQANRLQFQSNDRSYDDSYSYGGHGNRTRMQAPNAAQRESYSSYHQCPSGQCPYERSQYGAQTQLRQRQQIGERLQLESYGAYDSELGDRQGPASGSNYGSRRYDSGQFNASPSDRGRPISPADVRPQLRTWNFAPRSGFAADEPQTPNSFRRQPRGTNNIIPPPNLPPQPLAKTRSQLGERSPVPQLLPPTNSGGNLQMRVEQNRTDYERSGHDHAGHDHPGHNHVH